MLSRKSIKIISVVLLVAMMLVTFAVPSFAAGNDTAAAGASVTGSFTPDTGALSNTKAGNIANNVLGAIKWLGVAIAIGMLIFLGIKYVTSSPDGKADLKKQLGIYVIGFTFIVGATIIVGMLETMINQL